MAQATIGSLNVILGMDAGDFNTGVRQVEAGLGKLAAKFGFIAGVAAEAGRALVQSMGGALNALGAGFKKAIDDADAMDELAQKLGLTVEALSRIKYAAEISGVPIEKLTTGVTKLSVAMGDIAGGDTTSDAARTLQALGVAATDSAGQLRSTEDVLIALADKFASFEDNAAKTALAVNLFGKSGAELIPFLNQGRAGIAELSAEADRLGITLSGKTASAAGAFNETLDKLTAQISAGFKKAMEEALPFLQQVASWLLENDRVSRIVKGTIDLLVNAVKGLASIYLALEVNLKNATTRLLGFASTAAAVAKLDFTAASQAWGNMTAEIEARTNEATSAINRMWGSMSGQTDELDTSGMVAGINKLAGAGDAKGQAPIVASTQALAEASKAATTAQQLHNMELDRYNQLLREGAQIREEMRDPTEKLVAEQEKLNKLLNAGAIDADTYGKAMTRATAVSLNAYAGMASGIAGNLQKVFGESKAFAIAAAIINTAEAVTKTLATYGATPWGLAAAATAAAAGLAEVATIRSATKGGGGGGASGSSASSAAAAPAAAPQQQQGVFINLEGQTFGREQVRGLITQINDAVRDGARLVVSP